MAQATLVEMQIADGKRLIDRLVEDGVTVTAAGWVKESESERWYFYIASSLVGEDGATRLGYRRMNTLLREMQKEGWGIDPLEVKLIGPDDPIAKAIVAIRRRNPALAPSWFHGKRLGELAIEEAWIYQPRRIVVSEYRRRGTTSHWDVVSPGQAVPCAPGDRWTDREMRVEQQGDQVIIRVYLEEALQENNLVPALKLADEEFQKRFPGNTIHYPPDGDGP